MDLDGAVRDRRSAAGLGPEELDAPHWGLALSGGGIRSATFCFGLVRGLAANRMFRRFDYLSTVSGGGYLGAAIGRLYDGKATAQAIESGLARKDTLLLWWLRSNGRYLTPAGARDLGQAFASVLRGILSTHFEVGVLLMVLTGSMLLPYLLLQSAAGGDPWQWLANFHALGASIWLLALAAPAGLAFHNIFAYWFVRSTRSRGSVLTDNIAAAACALVGWRWGATLLAASRMDPPPALVPALLSALACLLLFTPATAVAWRLVKGEQNVAEARLHHTKGLALALWIALFMALAGLVDWASWQLAQWLEDPGTRPWAVALTALPAPLVAGARLALPYVKKWLEKKRTQPVKTHKLLNFVGLALLLLLALAWATVFQLLWSAIAWTWLPLPPDTPVASWAKWGILAGVPLGYVLLTRRDLEVLNLSSLHNFYRARVERAYVACGNRNRFNQGALAEAERTATAEARSLTEAVDGDDIALADYRPQVHGGPIHLVNCCINQTVDDRTQNYNADRKGVALTVSSLGAETGGQLPAANAPPVPGKLSMWAAISGAAASTGMGSETSPGLAALLFLSGMRLGYWQASLSPPEPGRSSPQSRTRLIIAEGMARFPGLRSPQWYLSDGGHFDNTGVYALLKRKVRLIVVADCGADPDYRFGDLENLVRKAQIDYGADIEFIEPPEPGGTASPSDQERKLRNAIALPAAIQRDAGAPHLLLARVTYADRSQATLVVVKPRRLPGMSLDIDAYASRNAPFPQQPTGDQFFDEEQWEAYHQLGVLLGRQLTAGNLESMRGWVEGKA